MRSILTFLPLLVFSAAPAAERSWLTNIRNNNIKVQVRFREDERPTSARKGTRERTAEARPFLNLSTGPL